MKVDSIQAGEIDWTIGVLRGLLSHHHRASLPLDGAGIAKLEEALAHLHGAARLVEREQRARFNRRSEANRKDRGARHVNAMQVATEYLTEDGFFFVGECRSPTAKRKGWTWKDGRLAAKPLFEALAAMKIDPGAHVFLNLWTDSTPPVIPWQRVQRIRAAANAGVIVVALGKRVSTELAKRGIDHVALVHPAARGAIRKRERYINHVKERLGTARAKRGDRKAFAQQMAADMRGEIEG